MKKGLKYIYDALVMAHRLDRGMLPTIALSAVMQTVAPFIVILVTSFVLDSLTVGEAFDSIIKTALIGVGVAFLCTFAAGWLDKYKSIRQTACYWKWENLTGEKSLSMDYPQLEDPKITQIRERMNSDRRWGNGISNTYWFFGAMVKAIAGLIFSIIIVYPVFVKTGFKQSRDLVIFLVFAFAICLAVLAYRIFVEKKRLGEYFGNISKIWQPIFIWSDFNYKCGKDVRIYKAQPLIRSTVENADYKAEARAETMRVTNVSGIGGGLSGISTALIMVGAYLFVSLLSISGGLSVGMVVRSASCFYRLIQGIPGLLIMLVEFSMDTQRLQSKFEYLKIPPLLYKGTLTTEKRADNDYEIEFHNVSFKYPGRDSYALKNISLKLNVGQRLAVVGMNGSGKTTMIKLLCRLYDPTEGIITLNGIDIKKYDHSEYMDIFSVVFQDFRLFSFTIGQNVASSVEVDVKNTMACLEKAGLGTWIRQLPEGINTYIYKDYEEGGIEISGGEAQKISLARALYKDAPFVILDEPTAALDPIAEYEIYSKFDEIVGDKTAVYISHRLSSCRFCHDIAVFHEGELVQRGSHEELLKDVKGKYYELWNAQAQYYMESQQNDF